MRHVIDCTLVLAAVVHAMFGFREMLGAECLTYGGHWIWPVHFVAATLMAGILSVRLSERRRA